MHEHTHIKIILKEERNVPSVRIPIRRTRTVDGCPGKVTLAYSLLARGGAMGGLGEMKGEPVAVGGDIALR